jgi:acetyl-CoA acyltransferase
MEKIYIAGVSMTRFAPQPERSIKGLVHEAVTEALADAGARRSDIGAAFFANAGQGVLEGQVAIRGQIALRSMGIEKIPVVNVENACASGSSAFNMAVAYLRAGNTDVALAVGAEKLCFDDQQKVMSIFEGGWDVHNRDETYRRLLAMGEGIEVPEVEGHRTVFMDVYSSFARAHMKSFGTSQRQLAAVSAKNHWHSQFNDKAHFRKPMSIEEVLAGRPLSYPLTVPMCAPLSDGAAATVLCTKEGLRRLQAERPVKVLASVLAMGSDRPARDWSQHIGRRVANLAYEQAGIGPEDISVAECHDASSVGELIYTEMLGFCGLGEGGVFAESGATRLGGEIPVNPSGGLECKGHPLGATGLAQIYELVVQLRGAAGQRQVEGARFAIAENGGGLYGIEDATTCITILGKE